MKRTKSMYYLQTTESRELLLYAENTYKIYMEYLVPAYEKLDKFRCKGNYNHEKAIDLMYQVSTIASNRYDKDFGYRFTVTERFTVAVDLVIEYEDEKEMKENKGGIYDEK